MTPPIGSIDSKSIRSMPIVFQFAARQNVLPFAVKILSLTGYLLLTGCTHYVVLEPHPVVEYTTLPISADIVIPEQTARYYYDVKSKMSGAVNTFRIEVGPALLQYAESFLGPVFERGDDVTIQIVILGFDVQAFEARINARFRVTQGGEIVFEKSYRAKGQGYYARTFWTRGFAMKSSMRNTTREALSSLFGQFLADVDIEYGNWIEKDQEF
ncbi:MAG: hypothetical protein ACRERU_23945 [Methylococcales bacterium]